MTALLQNIISSCTDMRRNCVRDGASMMAFIEAHHEQSYRYEEELCERWSEYDGFHYRTSMTHI